MLSIGGTYRHVTERAPTAKLGGDRWILNFSGRSCAWKARYIDLDQHMAFFVPLDRGIYDLYGDWGVFGANSNILGGIEVT